MNNYDTMRHFCAQWVMGAAWELVDPRSETLSIGALREHLPACVDTHAFEIVASLVNPAMVERRSVSDLAKLDTLMNPGERKRAGAYFTPPDLAQRMAARIPEGAERVLDHACGTGELLIASLHACPDALVIGIELDPILAVAAGFRVYAQAQSLEHRVVWGDGLADHVSDVDVVITNPPYLGEKGNREVFDEVKQSHPEFRDRFAARMDLHYLFLHKALDLLRPGGTMISLTSEYWLMADSAQKLRRDLALRSNVILVQQFGVGQFPEAPGHHSLIMVAQKGTKRRPVHVLGPGSEVLPEWTLPADPTSRWNPFQVTEHVMAGDLRLDQKVKDRQGFVSGMDRTTSRHSQFGIEAGLPVFLMSHSEALILDPRLDALLLPVLRAKDCEANRVIRQPIATADKVLWIDGPIDEPESLAAVEAYLDPYRQVLDARREVKKGTIPWYRLHWPRQRAEQAGPKLVGPRRGKSAAFCLDLSASAVSSDCTYLVCADDEPDPIQTLARLMLILNHPATDSYLRAFGKTKGEIIEYYSRPIREVPVGEWTANAPWTEEELDVSVAAALRV